MRGHLRKRSCNGWTVVVELGRDPQTGRRKQKWKSVRGTKKAAARELHRLIAAIDAGEYIEPSEMTLQELMAEWLSEHADRNCAPKTAERYRQLSESYIIPRVGQLPLKRCTTLALERLYNQLRDRGGKNGKPLSVKTVRGVAGIIHSALNAAQRWNLVRANPASACRLPKPEHRERRVLTDDEIEFLLDAARGQVYWVYAFLLLSAATGLRRGELLALAWNDCELEQEPAFLTVAKSLEQTKGGLRIKPPKNGRPRRLPLPSLAVEALRQHRQQQEGFRKAFAGDYRSDLDLIFATPEGEYLRPDSVTAKVCLLARQCGLKDVSLHTLRHTHGSQLLSEGVPLPTVSKRLGHSSVNITATIYAHAFAADELAAAEAWEARMQTARLQSVSNPPVN